ncbi:hypothetical protein HUU62_07370 [Rhodoferax sp. 4810]|nr:hypothetical protein [Rhodoferax jenense]
MWVTQTYLGTVEPEAKLFVYYLYEDYIPEQEAFTRTVQRKLESLGETYGNSVSLLMPNERYTAQIGGEMRKVEGLWKEVHGKLPGLLISTEPLSSFSPRTAEFTIVPFTRLSPESAADTIDKVRRLLDDQLHWNYEVAPSKGRPGVWSRIAAATELKPGVAGIRIDLKKLFTRE